MARATATVEVLASSIRLRTVGDIARDLGVSCHKVRYALHARGEIRPSRRIGNYPVFDDDVVDLIEQRINQISRGVKTAA